MPAVALVIIVIIWCLVARWGVRQDQRRRATREFGVTAREFTRLAGSFAALNPVMARMQEAIVAFGAALVAEDRFEGRS